MFVTPRDNTIEIIALRPHLPQEDLLQRRDEPYNLTNMRSASPGLLCRPSETVLDLLDAPLPADDTKVDTADGMS